MWQAPPKAQVAGRKPVHRSDTIPQAPQAPVRAPLARQARSGAARGARELRKAEAQRARGPHAPRHAPSPPPARGALEQPLLEQVGLVGVLDRVGLLTDALGERGEPDRAPREPPAQGVEDGPVHLVEAELVDAEQLEALDCRLAGDRPVAADLDEVPDPAQQAVRDARRAPRTFRDARRPLPVQGDPEDPGGPLDDGPQLDRLIEVESPDEAEAVPQCPATMPQRVVAPTRVKCGRSRRMERAVGPLPITMSSFASSMAGYSTSSTDRCSRWISSMNSHVTLLEVGEERGEVPGTREHRPRRHPQAHPHLGGHDAGERRLAETGRPGEEQVVGGLGTPLAASSTMPRCSTSCA